MSLALALITRASAAPAAPGSLDLLSALRDIHEPPAPGFWPPAPGWWLLAALLLAALVAVVLYLRRRHRRARPVRAGLAELDRWIADARSGGEPAAHAERLAALLRRVALIRYPRPAVAALTGEAWLQFLDRTSNSNAFTVGPGRVLGDERYAPAMTLDVDVLGAIARRWLQEHLDGATVEAERLRPAHAAAERAGPARDALLQARREAQESAVREDDEPELRASTDAGIADASAICEPGAQTRAPDHRDRSR